MNDWNKIQELGFWEFQGDKEIGQKKAQLAKVEWKSKVCESLLLKQIGANNEKGERYSLWLL